MKPSHGHITAVSRSDVLLLLAFLVYYLLAVGPGLTLFNRHAYAGAYPVLFLWILLWWPVGLAIAYLFGYRARFTYLDDESLDGPADQPGKWSADGQHDEPVGGAVREERADE